LLNIIQGYDTRDIWNVTKLDFSRKVRQTATWYILQEEKCKIGKLAKERLTIALLCSTTGEKFKPLLIGKSQIP
jgi:hypothetical protein